MSFQEGDRVRSLDTDEPCLGTVVKTPRHYYRPDDIPPHDIAFVHWDHFAQGKWAPWGKGNLEKVAA